MIPPRALVPRGDGTIEPTLGVAAGLGVPAASQWGPVPAPEAAAGVFTAAGYERRFGGPAFWADDRDGLLFLFALHGFTELARYARDGERGEAGDRFWQEVVTSWLDRHDAAPARPAWHAYPTSHRVLAWSSALAAGIPHDALAARMLSSLRRQVVYLDRAVEWDVGGNHVLRNLTATLAGALTLGLPGFADRALRRLEREARAQFDADGGHIEKSTSYHREMVHDLSEAAIALDRAGRGVPTWLESTVSDGTRWLGVLAAPDGWVPMLNDAWEGPAVTPLESGEVVTHLPASGLVVLRGDGLHAVLDVGALCPPELPPHAHADALSFTLWADGAPLVVDPGVVSYTGPDRDWYRSTAAHNTVSVDGRDQCEFWGDFRAGYLPRVEHSVEQREGGDVVVRGRHAGFRRGGPHWTERTFFWASAMGLAVVDRLTSGRRHSVAVPVQHAPGAQASTALRAEPLVGVAASEAGQYAPFLGCTIAAARLTTHLDVEPALAFGWTLMRPGWSAALAEGGRAMVTDPAGARREFVAGTAATGR